MIWGELGPGIWNNIRDSVVFRVKRRQHKAGREEGKNKNKNKEQKTTAQGAEDGGRSITHGTKNSAVHPGSQRRRVGIAFV